jgi:hypothetical protein
MTVGSETKESKETKVPKKGPQKQTAPKRKPGRPHGLTPAIFAAVVGSIQVGGYAVRAAEAAGIGESTYYLWITRGEAEAQWVADGHRPHAAERVFLEFLESIKRADAEAELYAVAVVQGAMSESWQAAMTYLERRHPDRWSRREQREHSGPSGGPIVHRLSTVTDEELASATDRLALAEKHRREEVSGLDGGV